MEAFAQLHPALQALIATCFTWFLTAVGASSVFFTVRVNRKLLDVMLGFAAGVMIAASYWSLLAPALEMAAEHPIGAWFPAAVGFLLGATALRIVDRLLPHLHLDAPAESVEGVKSNFSRSILLV